MALGVVFTSGMKYPVSPLVSSASFAPSVCVGPFVSFVSFVFFMFSVSVVFAQTAVPAIPVPAETRVDFSGTWSLDRSISTDLDKASLDAATDRSSQRAGSELPGCDAGNAGVGQV